jgi:hypothetical protein
MRLSAVVFACALTCIVPIRVSAAEGELSPFEDTTSKQVRMPLLVAPLVAQGRLQGYVYLQIIVVTPSRGQAEQLSLKIPYLQDAFVREVHRQTIVRNDDPKAIDGAGLKERLLNTIEAVAGSGFVEDLLFENTSEAAIAASQGPGEVQTQKPKPKASSGH